MSHKIDPKAGKMSYFERLELHSVYRQKFCPPPPQAECISEEKPVGANHPEPADTEPTSSSEFRVRTGYLSEKPGGLDASGRPTTVVSAHRGACGQPLQPKPCESDRPFPTKPTPVKRSGTLEL